MGRYRLLWFKHSTMGLICIPNAYSWNRTNIGFCKGNNCDKIRHIVTCSASVLHHTQIKDVFLIACLCVCVYVCLGVFYLGLCACAWVRACVCVCVRACVRACVCDVYTLSVHANAICILYLRLLMHLHNNNPCFLLIQRLFVNQFKMLLSLMFSDLASWFFSPRSR